MQVLFAVLALCFLMSVTTFLLSRCRNPYIDDAPDQLWPERKDEKNE